MANLIYIGTLSAMDTKEKNTTNENPEAIKGTYAGADMSVTDVTMSDNTHKNITYSDDGPNNAPADTFTYDTGSGTTVSALDGEALFRATYHDENRTQQSTTIRVFQLQNGDTFVGLPDGVKIQDLTIGKMVSDGYNGINSDNSSSATIVCFTADTLIDTPDGPRPVQTLQLGDLVTTMDNGAQPVRWHHCWQVQTTRKTAPVRIKAGALGDGVPRRDLLVSPQHRIMVRSAIAARMFGAFEVLVPAKKLLGLPGISQDPQAQRVTYAHFMCDTHEVVFANGTPAETLYPGPQARRIVADSLACTDLPRWMRDETQDGAQHRAQDGQATPQARQFPTGKQTRHMIARHTRNNKPLFDARAC